MNIVIAGGGTGGHLYPGIAVFEKLKSVSPAVGVYFIGTEKGIENRIKNDYDFEFFTINVKGFSGKNFMDKIRAVKGLFKAAGATGKIYKKIKPEFVLGLGGYISFVPLVMARLKGIRCGVMEQNAVPGLSNKLLGLFGITIFASFEETKKYMPFSRVIVTGNPVRKTIMDAAAAAQASASACRGIKEDLSVFIFGGSQGASSLNRGIIGILPQLDEAVLSKLSIFHQTGEKDLETIKNFYAHSGVGLKLKNLEIFPFTKNIEDYYVKSALVICRSGAGTLSELIAFRKPAILVPYPYAAKNHQEKNAEVFLKLGCFYAVKDNETLSKELLQTFHKIFYNRKLLDSMQNSLNKIEIGDSALKIAGIVLNKNLI